MSKQLGFATRIGAAWRRNLSLAALAGTLLCATNGQAQDLATRGAAADVAPSAVALAVLPPSASIADIEARGARSLWPTHGWQASTPEAQGIDSNTLADALATIRARHLPVHSLLVERHGRIVLDTYFQPFADNELHDVASVTKSVVSTLVGIAMRDRRIASLSTPVLQLVPDENAAENPYKSRMTLAHMLSMTSGLDCQGDGRGNFLQSMEQSAHWTDFALASRLVATPGTTFNYCAGNMQIVSAALTRTVGENAAAFARSELFAPLGIDRVTWATDRDGVSHGFSDLRMQPRDMAKLGYLWLHHGVWEGRQIVPASYIASALSPHAQVEQNVQYGYGMWLYPNRGHAGGAPDFEANGFGGQRIAVIPSQDMVVVTTGSGLDANSVGALIADIVKADGPLPGNRLAQARLDTLTAGLTSGSSRSLAAESSHHVRHGVVRTAALYR